MTKGFFSASLCLCDFAVKNLLSCCLVVSLTFSLSLHPK